tara:strand:+ start:17575 stop:18888 length:1314 start_codon:yes stop_codon:yes gene_type:complete
MEYLYAGLGNYWSAGQVVEMVSVSECRTLTFPMYYDLDMKLPMQILNDDAIQSIVRIIIQQTLRFYPVEMHETLGRCIVTNKSGSAIADAETGLYKHGVHVHFPRIIVDVDSARQIRMGVLNGLAYSLISWTEILGVDPGDDWNDIVDDSVYNTGLRMVGAPKATKCRECKPSQVTSCSSCHRQNNRYVIDDRYYKICMSLDADGKRNAEQEKLLRNWARLFTSCTVRTRNGTLPTQGYAIYPGCPQLTVSQLSAATNGRKRKTPLSSLTGAGKRPIDRRFTDEITNAKAIEIVRKYLLRYSTMYATCTLKLFRNGNTIRVKLAGDNSKFCINKEGHHRSNNVYMDIVRRGGNADSFMKCYCPCKTARESGLNCCDMGNRNKKGIDTPDMHVLFANHNMTPMEELEQKTMAAMFSCSTAEARRISDEMSDADFLLRF